MYRPCASSIIYPRGLVRKAHSIASTSQPSSTFYDVAVVGGGMVGNAAACSLGQSPYFSPHKILLLESGKPKSLGKPPVKYNNRVSAVGPGSKSLFEKLGIWDKLENEYRVRKVTGLYVADACSNAKLHFTQRSPHTPIAWMVENEAITSALYDRIVETCPNVHIQSGCRVDSCSIPDDLSENAEVGVVKDGGGNEERIATSLLVGADGANSVVRAAMNVDYSGWTYKQSTIVGTLRVVVDGGANHIAWQRFTPLGPIGILPLTDELSSLAWTTSSEDAVRLMQLPEDQFVDELNFYLSHAQSQHQPTNSVLEAMDNLIEKLPGTSRFDTVPFTLPHVTEIETGSRAAFPIGFGQARDTIRSRAALIGDAAHRIHPLAGQGVNLGWFDVKLLTACLEKAVREGADLGAVTYLSDYDTQSQRRNVPVMFMIDGLNRLYSNEFAPAVFLRSIGVKVLDRLLPPVKDFFIYMASK